MVLLCKQGREPPIWSNLLLRKLAGWGLGRSHYKLIASLGFEPGFPHFQAASASSIPCWEDADRQSPCRSLGREGQLGSHQVQPPDPKGWLSLQGWERIWKHP